MVRTKGQIRGSKSKGSKFEMDSEASLQQIYSDCFRTHDRGFIKEYDLQSEKDKIAVECKRLRAMSWNQAKRFLQKLIKRSPEGYKGYLLFQSNHQPCLVMYLNQNKHCVVVEFENFFGVPFIKHEPTKRKEVKKDDII
jgi:hypothetical protein